MIQSFSERGNGSTVTGGVRNIQLVAIDELERGIGGTSVALGIECKFSHQEVIDPVVLSIIAEHS